MAFGGGAALLLNAASFALLPSLIVLAALIFFVFSLARIFLELEQAGRDRHFFEILSSSLKNNNPEGGKNADRLNDRIFVPQIVEGAVNSRRQLGQALADLMQIGFQQLPLSGVEILLFEKSTSYFFFSLLMGVVPLEQKSRTLELPLSFSGRILGSVKFSSATEEEFSEKYCEVAKLITLQVGVLFINVEYSAELLKMQRSADETLRAKTGFLANLSHEVRSPLGVIVNATELVLDGLCGSISPDQKRILGLARNGSEHLLELINDVLDYARIEAGKLAPAKKDISVHEILKDVTNLIRFQAEQKKIEVVHTESLEALAVSVDRKHLRQILINLLTNAVKYTPDNGIIEVWAERAPGQMIRLNVKDSGVGIDAASRDKVFAPFERLNHSYSIQQAGVGLGLSLAQRLAELNGGSLDFESKSGEGSRFWVLLKSAEIDPLHKADKLLDEKSVKSNGELVVLIDHDPDHLEILHKYLLNLGYNLKTFPNYSEAALFLESESVQLLIMDNHELDDSESTVGAKIAELVQSRGVSVLLLSSRAFLFDLEKYLKLGVERCLPKPVALKELAMLCRQVLESRRSGSELKLRDISADSDKNESEAIISAKDLLH